YPECFVFVVRVGVFRGCGGAGRGLRAGADLLRGRRDPDLGGGCGTGGEQSEEQGERLHGASLVGCFPERRGFLVPAGQLRGLAAYCTSGVLLHAQSRAILGWAGTGEHVCLQGGTSAAAQSTAGVSRLNRDLRRFRRTSGGGAVLASWSRRWSRRHSVRQLDDTKRHREGLLSVRGSALRPAWRRLVPDASGVLYQTLPGVVGAAGRCIGWPACRPQRCRAFPRSRRAGGKRKRRPSSPASRTRCSPPSSISRRAVGFRCSRRG